MISSHVHIFQQFRLIYTNVLQNHNGNIGHRERFYHSIEPAESQIEFGQRVELQRIQVRGRCEGRSTEAEDKGHVENSSLSAGANLQIPEANDQLPGAAKYNAEAQILLRIYIDE